MGSVEPMIVNDVWVEGVEFGDTPAVSVFQMRAYIGVPIVLLSGHVYGTLCALDRAPRENTQLDLDCLIVLARLLASQLDRRELGVLEERNRLAREIHDTLAQTLTSLVLDLSTHVGNLRRQAPHLEAEAATMLDVAHASLREVRRSIWNLQPAALEGRTLAQAIDAETRQLERAGIQGVLEVRGATIDLPPGVETALLRVAQEALANARKHSGAANVVVTLDYGDEDVTLRVDDDGRGLDIAGVAPAIEGGFGLTSMRARARALGGDIVVEPRAGGGLSVVSVIPLTPASFDFRPDLAASRPASTPRVRVALADDHTLVREGLRRLLNERAEIEIVGEATNGEEALALLAREQPDVLLLDLQMPRLGGLQVLEQLKAAGASTRVIVTTTFARDETVFQAVRLGARGYLLKEASADELVDAVRTVAAGGTALTAAAVGRLAERLRQPDALTAREREVLGLVAEGLRNKEIAQRLGASEKTVQFHIANVFGKLGAQSRTEAVRIALERGLLGAV